MEVIMKKIPKPVSWVLRTLLLVTILYVGYNFWKDASVTKIDQTNTSTPVDVSNSQSDQTSASRVGTFIGSGNYSVSGTATITKFEEKYTLTFDKSFSSSSGPDLEVYLSKNKVGSGEQLGEFVSLQRLKSTTGEQVYNLPDNADEYSSIVIWCRAFSVKFGAANLE
jgi:Electron transfer DM13